MREGIGSCEHLGGKERTMRERERKRERESISISLLNPLRPTNTLQSPSGLFPPSSFLPFLSSTLLPPSSPCTHSLLLQCNTMITSTQPCSRPSLTSLPTLTPSPSAPPSDPSPPAPQVGPSSEGARRLINGPCEGGGRVRCVKGECVCVCQGVRMSFRVSFRVSECQG